MHSTRHDANLAALQASTALPGQVLDLIVLTSDAGLLARLRDASGAEHAIWHAATAEAAVDLLVGGRCGVFVADLDTLRGDAAALLERLHAQFPELILLATGRREEEATIASLLSSGGIYRYLHKPISPARAGLFVEAATQRYYELRDIEPLALTTVRTIAARPDLRWILAAILAVLAAAVGWYGWRSRGIALPELQQQRAAAEPSLQEQAAVLLARGQMAYATGRLDEPPGDNALEYFRGVLALDPDHREARAGIERVVLALEARVRAALQTRDAPQGARAFTALQRAAPDLPQLEALRAELLSISRATAREAKPAPPGPTSR